MKARPHTLEWLVAALLTPTLPTVYANERDEAAGRGFGSGLLLAPQWHMRVGMTAELHGPQADTAPAGRSLSLFGDYYISRAFGLRATGGIVLGRGTGGESATLWPTLGHLLELSPGRAASWWQEAPPGYESGSGANAAPYLGLGYTVLAGGGSLGLFADVGLGGGLKPRSSVQLGNSTGTLLPGNAESGTWRTWREWHFAPVLQLGVSYAF